MNANLKLLAKDYPRSPRETLAAYVFAARMLDKCRAVVAGTVLSLGGEILMFRLLSTTSPRISNRIPLNS
jgi:hypothetical protein